MHKYHPSIILINSKVVDNQKKFSLEPFVLSDIVKVIKSKS